MTLRIPHGDGAALALCYERGHVFTRTDEEAHVKVHVSLPSRLADALVSYRV